LKDFESKKKMFCRNFKKKLTSKNRPPNRKNRKRTGLERCMMEILKDLYLEYEEEFPVFFAGEWKVYDFLVEGNLLIEVDGNYWHGKLDKESKIDVSRFFQLSNKKNDIKKNFIAKRKGYKMLRFWEDDVFDRREEVINRIMSEINDNDHSDDKRRESL